MPRCYINNQIANHVNIDSDSLPVPNCPHCDNPMTELGFNHYECDLLPHLCSGSGKEWRYNFEFSDLEPLGLDD